jgi:phage shock protein C
MKRLYRSHTDRKIAGIFGGLGELYEVDPNLLRLIAVLLFLVSGFFPVLVTYIVAWFIIPNGEPASGHNDTVKSTTGEEVQKKQPAKKAATKKG